MASSEYGNILIKPGELSQFKPSDNVKVVSGNISDVIPSGNIQEELRKYETSGRSYPRDRVSLNQAPALKESTPDFSKVINEIKGGTYIDKLNMYISESPTGAGSTGVLRYPTPKEVKLRREDVGNLYDRPLREVQDIKYRYTTLTNELYTLNPETQSARIEEINRELEKIGAKKVVGRNVIETKEGKVSGEDYYYYEAPKIGYGFGKKRQISVDLLDTNRLPEEKPTYTGIIFSSAKYTLGKNIEEGLIKLGIPERGFGTKQMSKDVAYVGQGIKSLWENIRYSSDIQQSRQGLLLPGGAIVVPEGKKEVKVNYGTGYYNPFTREFRERTEEVRTPLRIVRSSLKPTEEVMKLAEEKPELFYLPITKPSFIGSTIGNVAPYILAPPLIQVEYVGKLGEITFRKGNLWEGVVTTAKKYPFETAGFVIKTGADIYKGANKFFNEPIERRIKLSPEKRTDDAFRFLGKGRVETRIDPLTGKEYEVSIQKATGIWDVVKTGEKVEITTRARELFGAKVRFDLADDVALGVKTTYIPATPIYSGNPADITGRQEALKLLEKLRGLSPEQAKQVIKLTRPGLFEETFSGNVITQYSDDTVKIFAEGTRTTTSLPGEILGVKYMQITPRVKVIGEVAKPLFTLDLTKEGGRIIDAYKFAGIVTGKPNEVIKLQGYSGTGELVNPKKVNELPFNIGEKSKPEAFFGTGATVELTPSGGFIDPITGTRINVVSNVEYGFYRDVDLFKKLNIPKTLRGGEITDQKFFTKLFSGKTPELSTGYTIVERGALTEADDAIFSFQGGGRKSSADYFQKLYGEVIEKKQVEALAAVTKPTVFKGTPAPNQEVVKWTSQTGIPASEYYGKSGRIIEEVEILRRPQGVTRDITSGVIMGVDTLTRQGSIVVQQPIIQVEQKEIGTIGEVFKQPVVEIINTGISQRTDQALGSLSALATTQITAQQSITSQRTTGVSTTYAPGKSKTIFTPKIIKSLFGEGTEGKSEKLVKGLFKVKVRKKGEDITIGEFETLPKARRKLKSELIETISASGIIERAGKPLKFEEIGIYGNQFRRAKADPFRVVQKKEARIKTGGEITQILKTRKAKGGWFR